MPKLPTAPAPTEVVADPANDRRHRRRFSREEKLRILAEADRCKDRGEVGALLRKEGLYSSHLSMWRQQLRAHGEAGLDAKPVGRKPVRDDRDRKLEQLERDKAKLERELALARKVIELAGKAHEILGVALPSLENDEKL
jgi:transposase-like protein